MDHQFRDTASVTQQQYLEIIEGIDRLGKYLSKLDREGDSDDREGGSSVQKAAASADSDVSIERAAPELLPADSVSIERTGPPLVEAKSTVEQAPIPTLLPELSNPDAQNFMEQLKENYEAQGRMAKVPPGAGKVQSKPEDAEAMINLYASKEVGQENYALKDGGEIIQKEDSKGYQHFEVTDPAGNIDMAFTVCPNGQVLVDPVISSQLQNQIDSMTKARENGELDDNTPLMSRDKARVEAMEEFQRNLSIETAPVKTEKLEVRKDRNGNVSATSKSKSAQMQMTKKATGGFRVTRNSLSTEEIRDFNDAFQEQRKLSASSIANINPVGGKNQNNKPKNKKSKSHAAAQ